MAESVPNYDELSLRIVPGAEGAYGVMALGPDGSTASAPLSLPFDETQLDNFVLRVGRQRRGVRAYRSSQMEEAKRFGARLFEALVSGAVRDVYIGARRLADAHGRGLRVTLYLTEVPELMGVPWEFLYERPSFLSQSMYTPVVRSLDLTNVRPPRKVTLPLRILGLVSRPLGFETLDVLREQDKLADALGPLRREGLVELRWLERATLGELDDAISRRDEVHIVHYVGHGAYDARSQGGILVLEDERGGPHEVSGEEIGSLLQDERGLRLVVLNACEGARGSHVDPFSGVASSLVEYGIPAVIGMQFEITDEAAITFAGRLYGALAQGLPVDAAIAQARRAIFAAGNDIEFGTPVLFLRATEARLFDVEHHAPPPQGSLTSQQIVATASAASPPVDDEPPGNSEAAAVPTADWSSGAYRVLQVRHARYRQSGWWRSPTVTAVALNPNGTHIATASDDNTARVWDVEGGEEIACVRPRSWVLGVAFRSDGRRIATASGNTARVWEVASGRELVRVGHRRGVTDVTFSPDGAHIATASWDNTARVWEAQSGREVTRVTHDGAVGGVAFSPDGTHIATASDDKTARLWEAQSGREVTRVTHDGAVNGVAFSPDGTHIATASDDNAARLWEAQSGREVTRVFHDHSVARVAFNSDGRRVATCSLDNAAVWEAR
jgi:hypothetical protein